MSFNNKGLFSRVALSKAITIGTSTTLIISIKTNAKIYNNHHSHIIMTPKYKHLSLPILSRSLKIVLSTNNNSNSNSNRNSNRNKRIINITIIINNLNITIIINNLNKIYKDKDILTFYITSLITGDMQALHNPKI